MARYPKRVTRSEFEVHDGDTIRVKIKVCGSNYIRPQGFNTPERGKRGYDKAKKDLKSILRDKKLIIYPKAIRQRRVIAKVKAGRKDITKAMKKKGW